jgi:hypothetical protein
MFQELNNDQRRESVNTRQRFEAWGDAKLRLDGYRGSMVWAKTKGSTYLRRSYYVGNSSIRKQTSLGPKSAETERMKSEFERGRSEAKSRYDELTATLERQAAINRAVGIGRLPLIVAQILRALDNAGLLGNAVRIVGTNAIYAYEAVAGVFVDPEVTSTEDIDLLLDARKTVRMIASEDVPHSSLLTLLRRIDHSFVRDRQRFRAINKDGFLVDLIEPLRDPPWAYAPGSIGKTGDDLEAVEIEGLVWLENSPPFEAIVVDVRGTPARMVAPDPRVFVAHKLWLSRRANRDPQQRRRDAAQARVVAQMVKQEFLHLPFERDALKMLPREVFDRASRMFADA